MKGIKRINKAWVEAEVIKLMESHNSDPNPHLATQSRVCGFEGGRPPDPVHSAATNTPDASPSQPNGSTSATTKGEGEV